MGESCDLSRYHTTGLISFFTSFIVIVLHMMALYLFILFSFLCSVFSINIVDESEVLLERYKRGIDENDIKDALCKDKNPGEFFRLVAGSSHCRDVVSCTEGGLQAIRCPPGLAFDLDKQTCEWKASVKNCNVKARPKLALPLFNTTFSKQGCRQVQWMERTLYSSRHTFYLRDLNLLRAVDTSFGWIEAKDAYLSCLSGCFPLAGRSQGHWSIRVRYYLGLQLVLLIVHTASSYAEKNLNKHFVNKK